MLLSLCPLIFNYKLNLRSRHCNQRTARSHPLLSLAYFPLCTRMHEAYLLRVQSDNSNNSYNQAQCCFPHTFSHTFIGPSPVVVASSATAVVVVAVVITLVTVAIILMVGVYVPYKKYKNRMTETADFRFVDLSENGNFWDRFKLKSNQLLEYFRRKRHNEKIGLVNLGSVPLEEDRRMFYGTNTLTQFAPYETL